MKKRRFILFRSYVRAVGCVAGVAGQALRMLRRDHRREPLRLGGVGFMAAGAENAGIGQNRLHRCWIFGMLRLRAVAGLAVHSRVLTGLLEFEDVGVTGLAGFVTGVFDGKCGNFRDGISAIVAVLAKALGNKPGPEAQEESNAYQEDAGDSDEVLSVLKSIHS
jgi:hypothetical protein